MSNNSQPTICLNMIVKNESKIIQRLLESVSGIIDTYCICDTGSTDNTIEIITNYFNKKNIQGKIVQEPFVNFEHNRNFALKSCFGMSGYILLMDADMQLKTGTFSKQNLINYDAVQVLQGNDDFFYNNVRIIKNDGIAKYIGVTHEYISTPNTYKIQSVPKQELFINDIGDGGAKNDKFERDVRLLEKSLLDDPKNERTHFYLANSYFDNGQFDKAIDIYKKRIELGGWDQEVWYSYYRTGICYKNLNRINDAIVTWLDGYNCYPRRLENLYEIMHYYRHASKHKLVYKLYEICKQTLEQKHEIHNYLFLYNSVYTYLLYYEYSIIASYIGIKNINDEIIQILNNCKEDVLNHNLFSNMKFYKDILKPTEVIDNFDSSVEIILNDDLCKYKSSSSCLIPNKDAHGYHMNVRYVNYYITDNGSYINCDKHIATVNRYLELDANFNITNDKYFKETDTTRRYVGIEDIKIYNDEFTNQKLFIGTGFHKSNNIGIVSGVYDTNRDMLEHNELYTSFSNNACEKNWVYTPYNNSTHIIYDWHPLKICKLNQNVISVVKEQPMPHIFKYIRGSTCGVKSNNEIWFITHLVSYEEPRHYYHMFVVFDESMKLLRYSAPFKFEGTPIEYCLGFIIEDNRVLINYSCWDRTTRIGVYEKTYLNSITKYT